MAETTRPTGEQLRFHSQATGTHILDDYLEQAEAGSRTLADLIGELFDNIGELKAFSFRLNNDQIEYKVGTQPWTAIMDFSSLTNARDQAQQAATNATSAKNAAVQARDDINSKFTVSTAAPTASDGQDGDVWLKIT